MFYALMGYLHAAAYERVRAIRALAEGQRGQGTVEYVGLILLVSLLMVGMVAGMKGFNKSRNKGGTRSNPGHGINGAVAFTRGCRVNIAIRVRGSADPIGVRNGPLRPRRAPRNAGGALEGCGWRQSGAIPSEPPPGLFV